jgi:hypothetical protein
LTPHALTPEIASRFATIALGHVTREYPHKLDHVMSGPEDVLGPRALHPIFFGSFDWHSCVHGWWLLLRLRRQFPGMEETPRITALADEMLTPEKVAGELAYLDRAFSGGFERPYGWGWLLALMGEVILNRRPRWDDALAPLAGAFADRFIVYLGKLTYPIRVGTHYNTAFAMLMALSMTDVGGHDLEEVIRKRALDWFREDRGYHGWEPGGDEFLSGGLTEALLMRRLLTPAEFAAWFDAFLPDAAVGEPRSLFTPAFVSDRSDGKIAHLDGLNLSRAWCWRGIADAVEPSLAELFRRSADEHLDASLPHVAGDYMGEHWLATFALLALEA